MSVIVTENMLSGAKIRVIVTSYFAGDRVRIIAMSVSVCLFCPLAYLKNDMTKLHEILRTCGHGPVVLI